MSAFQSSFSIRSTHGSPHAQSSGNEDQGVGPRQLRPDGITLLGKESLDTQNHHHGDVNNHDDDADGENQVGGNANGVELRSLNSNKNGAEDESEEETALQDKRQLRDLHATVDPP